MHPNVDNYRGVYYYASFRQVPAIYLSLFVDFNNGENSEDQTKIHFYQSGSNKIRLSVPAMVQNLVTKRTSSTQVQNNTFIGSSNDEAFLSNSVIHIKLNPEYT